MQHSVSGGEIVDAPHSPSLLTHSSTLQPSHPHGHPNTSDSNSWPSEEAKTGIAHVSSVDWLKIIDFQKTGVPGVPHAGRACRGVLRGSWDPG
jgi:hypothetical protein